MEEVAERIVSELEPAGGWWKSGTAETLKDVAIDMLEELDEDTVEECLSRTIGAMAQEYGE